MNHILAALQLAHPTSIPCADDLLPVLIYLIIQVSTFIECRLLETPASGAWTCATNIMRFNRGLRSLDLGLDGKSEEANPPRLLSNIEFVNNFGGDSLENGEIQYIWCQFCSAVAEIRHLMSIRPMNNNNNNNNSNNNNNNNKSN
ncbi:unnamed protein product [Trichobilharzia regenti]|nr:unnamed protein product [Trichobilharzia regenti]